jgi:imidazoleglycerol-phosphate dehydratase
MKRKAEIVRKTKETDISLVINLDGKGKSQIETGIPFFNHMLTLFSKHGLVDLELRVKGDIEVDFHHTVEDTAICLGQAFKKALADANGITRYSSGIIPMDESVCQLAIDISGRPYFEFIGEVPNTKVGDFDLELLEEFFRAFVFNAGITMHMWLLKGKNMHHISEACFKALGIILNRATQIDPRIEGIPSTKGII